MKVSIVTISFNQGKYLRECMESVLAQASSDLEYIVVDPGSTDGSREIIESYGDRVVPVFERDAGPADGLNRGFKRATGDVFGFINADDVLMPGAVRCAVNALVERRTAVVHGHAYVIDGQGQIKRKLYSDKFNLKAAAYGACVVIQPSTFFLRRAFEAVGGFEMENRSNWDGELFIDMALAGFKFSVLNEFLSAYRVYAESITGSGKFAALHKAHRARMYEKICNRSYSERSELLRRYFKYRRRLLNYRDSFQRLINGPVFMSGK